MNNVFKDKIEHAGIPLKEWNINIYRGILTGYNEAFIIDGKKRQELIDKSPNSADIIRPILRGRNIKKYGLNQKNDWIIIIPCGWTNKHRNNVEPEIFFKESFPAIYNHLMSKSELPSKGKGLFDRDDKGNYWWELRPCDYLSEFEKEKIIYIDIMTDNTDEGFPFPCFSYSKDYIYTLNTAYFMVGSVEDLRYITAILNSKVGKFIVVNKVTPLQKRQYRLFQQFVEEFPIPVIPDEIKQQIVFKAARLLSNNHSVIEMEKVECEIQEQLFKFYKFDKDESDFLESL